MVVIDKLSINTTLNSSALTIGSFDGMHLGHLKVLNKLKKLSINNNVPSVVITFNPHPKSILSKNKKNIFEAIITLNKKLELLDLIGIDYVWLVPFNKDIAKVKAEVFLNDYIMKKFKPNDIVVGFDHHFGHNKEGDDNFLKNKSDSLKYKLHVVSPFYLNDTAVSSTQIRKYIKSYNLNRANRFLGREYEIVGTVVRGNGVGRKIDFPTANIVPTSSNQLIPAKGVYCVEVLLDDKKYLGMCNIGSRPTFYDNGDNVIEVHLLTEDRLSLLDSKIKIIFKGFLRKENKYKSSLELIKQLEEDRRVCIDNY